jgi:hypothetical protein
MQIVKAMPPIEIQPNKGEIPNQEFQSKIKPPDRSASAASG